MNLFYSFDFFNDLALLAVLLALLVAVVLRCCWIASHDLGEPRIERGNRLFPLFCSRTLSGLVVHRVQIDGEATKPTPIITTATTT